MKKLSILLLIFFLPACFKKKKVNSAPVATSQKASSDWRHSNGSVKFDDDVDEFFLEDDEEGNVFDKGLKYQGSADKELQMAGVSLEDHKTENVQFNYDSTKIKPEELSKIERNVEHSKDVLKDNPNAVVVVDGHSCKIAKSQTYNYMISQERASNVAKEYVKRGVPAEKVKSLGHGSSELLTNTDGKDAQSVNRRAETHFVQA